MTAVLPPGGQGQAVIDALQFALQLTLRSFSSWNASQVARFYSATTTIHKLIQTPAEQRTKQQIDDAFAELRFLEDQLHPEAKKGFDSVVQLAHDIINKQVTWVPKGGKHL